jgi:CRISPR-associated protein Csh1
MFDDILLKGILDDIKTDDYDTKTEQNSNRPKILEKLNIWFTLYNFFHLSKQENLINMISKIERHRKKIDAIIEKNSKELLSNEGEFAYAAGHCVRYLYTKSKTKDKSYSRLETFVQKSNCRNLLEAITNFFVMYKHENMTNTFGRLFAQVMNFESQDNMKKYLPEFLSGFFDNNKLFSEKTQDETKNK